MLQHRMTHATLGEVLRWRAQTQPERSAFTFLADGENLEQQISYAGLDRQARAIAATLQEQGFAGERTLLLYPAGLSFLAAFMGCIYARVTAIPVPAHFQDPTRLQRTLPRLRAIAADAGASLVLTVPEMLAQTGLILEQAPDLGTLRWLDTEAIPLLLAEAWQPPEIQPDDLVFLQYSSGSTGLPKGVMVSHANLMHNLAAISHAFGHSEASTGVSWLPAYHDMGLVADVLQPLYAGFHQVFMSPFDFIRRPLRWLEAISRYHASTSGAPNFAYALCAAKVQEEELAALDLSAWEIAYNCAEPVSAEAIERFAATFAACGFRRRAFFPYLGMAEATLMVSAGAKDAEPVFLPVSRAALLQGR
ncbi:MAG TPA: AMP-binding protein, partial [Candidatus Obscuribacterales bacterium]